MESVKSVEPVKWVEPGGSVGAGELDGSGELLKLRAGALAEVFMAAPSPVGTLGADTACA
ncbi:hypothetical protein PV416_31750 [Streptomyces ipomoeae]|jgi:hypothetical protein|uniref:hypothetical protein n=1 Tax=Streptomyces ipomoeae TaxID=103232 RepID=UPI0006941AE9|nr:hypothetical protein [Streptomyces ipomoeae]MDX2825526.1 hypothetical protein [Streptomyces ipomoeae]